ncbi:uncharacterized protein A4U43_C08F15860 [Asparagus officinalis]|nr:uncharacterized protein A4U43_C08F15860 [Asparagus officinalis]
MKISVGTSATVDAHKESLIAQTEKDMFKALKEMKSALIHQVFMEFDVRDVIKTIAEETSECVRNYLSVMYLTKVFLWSELLRAFCITEECELELLKQVHRRSIKEQRLQGLFKEVVDVLYEFDVLSPSTIHQWFYLHISAVDREEAFVKDLKPVVDSMEKEMLEAGLTRA